MLAFRPPAGPRSYAGLQASGRPSSLFPIFIIVFCNAGHFYPYRVAAWPSAGPQLALVTLNNIDHCVCTYVLHYYLVILLLLFIYYWIAGRLRMFLVHVGRRMAVIPITDLSHGRLALRWPEFLSNTLQYVLHYALCCLVLLWSLLISYYLLCIALFTIIKYYPTEQASFFQVFGFQEKFTFITIQSFENFMDELKNRLNAESYWCDNLWIIKLAEFNV